MVGPLWAEEGTSLGKIRVGPEFGPWPLDMLTCDWYITLNSRTWWAKRPKRQHYMDAGHPSGARDVQ